MPEAASAQVNVTVTSVLFHPAAFGDGDATAVIVGGALSTLTVTLVAAWVPARSDARLRIAACEVRPHVGTVPAGRVWRRSRRRRDLRRLVVGAEYPNRQLAAWLAPELDAKRVGQAERDHPLDHLDAWIEIARANDS